MNEEQIKELVDKMSGWNSVMGDQDHSGYGVVALAHICQNQSDLGRLLAELILEVRALRASNQIMFEASGKKDDEIERLRKIEEYARVYIVCTEERIDASEAIKTGDLCLAHRQLREALYG